MTPEEKTKVMKLYLNSKYGKMTTEALYADTDSIRFKGTIKDITPAIEVIREMKETSYRFGGSTILRYLKPDFDTFCNVLIEILEDAERKLNA